EEAQPPAQPKDHVWGTATGVERRRESEEEGFWGESSAESVRGAITGNADTPSSSHRRQAQQHADLLEESRNDDHRAIGAVRSERPEGQGRPPRALLHQGR